MAKDVSIKGATNSNTDNTSSSISDQQKVPPLRIVLNTSGNQKSSSSSAIAVTTNQQQQQQQDPQQSQQQTDLKREKSGQDVKEDPPLKSGGRVRIKLGTNKQAASCKSGFRSAKGDDQKLKQSSITTESGSLKEDLNTKYSGHLRRITRRSQRSIQTVSNEDEESISSMTSIDENQNTTNNNSSDTASVQDTTTTSTTTTATTSTTQAVPSTSTQTQPISNNGASEPQRRYKRRKGELNDYQLSSELQDALANSYQNYKPPNQNSFELYKNIRKQVDKKLKNLTSVPTRTPLGFRDYMMMRGSYLLDGNKLGNGTNLYTNEEGGLYTAPLEKRHYHHHSRNFRNVFYSVPNRAKVPLGLAVNSPLYNLFIDQEKERHRMRMQHIKEREKLTLSAEQEMVRVYNQAAMAAANQLEPFSACTMLKHQEIYNYMDSDGFTILSNDDAQHENQANQQPNQDQNMTIVDKSSPQNNDVEESVLVETKKDNELKEANDSSADFQKDESRNKSDLNAKEVSEQVDENAPSKEIKEEKIEKGSEIEDVKEAKNDGTQDAPDKPKEATDDHLSTKEEKMDDNSSKLNDNLEKDDDDKKNEIKEISTSTNDTQPKIELAETSKGEKNESPTLTGVDGNKSQNVSEDKATPDTSTESETLTKNVVLDKKDSSVPMEQDEEVEETEQKVNDETTIVVNTSLNGHVLSDDDRKAYNKEIFLAQLQEVDDKWDKIRHEMLIRHRNEAESLYAVQMLEWEWKTKEIGACDVRTTPIIDNTLVPKLNIYSQDY